jgi:hypothetical protein
MKKILLFITIALAFTFFGCQKDGAYNPSKQLKRIYVMLNSKKTLSEEWSWSNNLLTKIEYYYLNTGNLAWSSTFSYDGKRISKIQDSDGYSTYFKYSGNNYEKVEYYNAKSELLLMLMFTHTGNKITSIEGQYYYSVGKSAFNLDNYNQSYLTTLIPELRLDEETVMRMEGSKGGIDIIYWNFEYSGDNLSKLEKKEGTKITTNDYEKYDKNSNPFYHNLDIINGSLNLILSKNNVLNQTTKYSDGSTAMSEYTYIYDGSVPTEVQRKRISGGDVYLSTTYYEYVK